MWWSYRDGRLELVGAALHRGQRLARAPRTLHLLACKHSKSTYRHKKVEVRTGFAWARETCKHQQDYQGQILAIGKERLRNR